MDYDQLMHNINSLADMIVESKIEKRKEHLVNRLGALIKKELLAEGASDRRVINEIHAAIEEAEFRASYS